MEFIEVVTRLLEQFHQHRGKVLGLLSGFLVSILLLTVGFIKTFFIVGCSLIGYFIGKRIDNHEDLRDIVDRILPTRD